MCTFIEDYLSNPSDAIAAARERANGKSWSDQVDERMIYREIASPEFRLYEEIIMSEPAEDAPKAKFFATVA